MLLPTGLPLRAGPASAGSDRIAPAGIRLKTSPQEAQCPSGTVSQGCGHRGMSQRGLCSVALLPLAATQAERHECSHSCPKPRKLAQADADCRPQRPRSSLAQASPRVPSGCRKRDCPRCDTSPSPLRHSTSLTCANGWTGILAGQPRESTASAGSRAGAASRTCGFHCSPCLPARRHLAQPGAACVLAHPEPQMPTRRSELCAARTNLGMRAA